MTDLPRVLALMGSGETAPTMARVHRQLAARLPPPARGVLVDTPYGFQENADELTTKALGYFRHHIGLDMEVASIRSVADDPLARAAALERVRQAGYLFAGPGSPTYTLDVWAPTELPAIVAERLATGGVVVFASAAALTLGSHTVPVYEIYKVGEPPVWRQGLDILGPLGLPVAVIPHYDNTEGGTHDTRFCYLGERRLEVLEALLPAGTFVLGIDSHTALILDLEDGTAQVEGLGGVVVRVAGRSQRWPAGSSFPIEELRRTAAELARDPHASTGRVASDDDLVAPLQGGVGASAAPLMARVATLAELVDDAIDTGRPSEAAARLLDLETLIHEWDADTDGGPDAALARERLRGLVARLGASAAANGAADSRITPLVELLLDLRERARVARDYRQADWIRGTLTDLDIEVRDGDDTTAWVDHRAAP